ncbi:TSUP family transporter [Undibacterium arcticum]|uniref:Probable membrane transporter protein n=1 Tax=Undibacterium arcticum TaxID=1762892 RepID=A0ABV7EVJ3_9BURK
MHMHILIPYLAVIAVATYFQTVTGFGLGMIVMGAASGLELVPVATIATTISLLSLVNCAVALPGTLHHIDWRTARTVIYGIVPSVIGGVLLLNYLGGSASHVLKLLLGLVIIHGGISVMLKVTPDEQPLSNGSFFFSGFFSGLFSGMFGIAGPPLVYQFYRQKMDLVSIRYSLIFLFAVTAGIRTLFVASQGGLSPEIVALSLSALPVVGLATLAGKRYPPPLRYRSMQCIAFAVLIGIGLSLMVSAAQKLL